MYIKYIYYIARINYIFSNIKYIYIIYFIQYKLNIYFSEIYSIVKKTESYSKIIANKTNIFTEFIKKLPCFMMHSNSDLIICFEQ